MGTRPSPPQTRIPAAQPRFSAFSCDHELRNPGYTPIGLALTEATQALANQAGTVILISDGEDTCAPPDPCETARQLKTAHPELSISTVGLRVGGTASEQMSCIAAATGGVFVTADNTTQLTSCLMAAFAKDSNIVDEKAARIAISETGATNQPASPSRAPRQSADHGPARQPRAGRFTTRLSA